MEIKDDNHIAHSTSKEQKDDILSTQEIIETFLVTIKNTYPILFEQEKLLRKACEFADKAHKWQFRKISWQPYLEHPLAVSLLLAERFGDITLVIAAILHDTVEDNDYIFIEDVYNIFGTNVWFLVDAVTDNTNYYYGQPKKAFSDKIQKLLYGWMQDVRCLLLKLADREHNLTTLKWLHTHKQIRIGFETQSIYMPLRKILQRDERIDIWTSHDLFSVYRKEKKLDTPILLQQNLYSRYFHNFDTEIFWLVYGDSKSIVRSIESRDFFENMLKNNELDESIHILEIDSDWYEHFRATFIFLQWKVFDTNWSDLKIAYFNN